MYMYVPVHVEYMYRYMYLTNYSNCLQTTKQDTSVITMHRMLCYLQQPPSLFKKGEVHEYQMDNNIIHVGSLLFLNNTGTWFESTHKPTALGLV